jgi:hypothetical protein
MRADIHDESGATTSSSHRPDTLMQDRICQIDENLLHPTAGPYIGVKSVALTVGRSLPVYPDNRTSQVSAATSHLCQQATSITNGSSVRGDCKLKESTLRFAPGRPQLSAVGCECASGLQRCTCRTGAHRLLSRPKSDLPCTIGSGGCQGARAIRRRVVSGNYRN